MSTYRIFFRDEPRRICGRQDFDAGTELSAVRIASALADACADVCRNFELWSGSHIVYQPRHIGDGVCELNERHQEIVVQTEEMIRRSKWRIAESQRLIERLNDRTDGGPAAVP